MLGVKERRFAPLGPLGALIAWVHTGPVLAPGQRDPVVACRVTSPPDAPRRAITRAPCERRTASPAGQI